MKQINWGFLVAMVLCLAFWFLLAIVVMAWIFDWKGL